MEKGLLLRLTGILVLITVQLSGVGSKANILYLESDPIVILNHDTLQKTIHDSGNAWFVEFYNSWCGHCIRFAPVWKIVGRSVEDWSSLMRVAAIDCSTEENNAICRQYDIEGYPTLKMFPAHSPEGDTGQECKTKRDVATLREGMAQFLVDRATGGDQDAAVLAPLLLPLRSMEHIWDHVGSGVEHIAVVFEDEDSLLGSEVILDMLVYRQLVVRRMLAKDVQKYVIRDFPSMFRIDKGGTFHTLVTKGQPEDYTAALRTLLGLAPREPLPREPPGHGEGEDGDGEGGRGMEDYRLQEEDEEGGGGPGSREREEEGETSQDMDIVLRATAHEQDLLSALHYSLRLEVPTFKALEGDTLTALQAYIAVLAKYFPGPNGVVGYLRRLDHWLQQTPGPVLGTTWLDQVNSLQEKSSLLPARAVWTGCQGSQPHLRGYPCSLWSLFHTLTVNSVLDHGADPAFSPREVLVAMRGYIKHFFGCRECSVNFLKGAVHIEEAVHTANDSILFLWKSHNKANFFLRGDITEDPERPKVQFPPPELCPRCHVTAGREDAADASDAVRWDETQVLLLLQRIYGKRYVIKDGDLSDPSRKDDVISDSQLQNNTKAQDDKIRKADLARLSKLKEEKKQKTAVDGADGGVKYDPQRVERWRQREADTRVSALQLTFPGLTSIDMSLCILFWVMCVSLILVLYFHLVVRRRMKLPVCPKGFSV